MVPYSKGIGLLRPVSVTTPLALREYQKETHRKLKKWDKSAKREGCIIYATGMGKTFTAASFAGQRSGQLLWVTHRDTLLHQAKNALESSGMNCDVLKAESYWVDARGLVASVQTLKGERLESLRNSGFQPGLIVFDEAHHVEAETWRAIKDAFPTAKCLHLTATPFHGEVGNKLDLGEVIDFYTTKEAQEMGVLVDYATEEVPLWDLLEMRERGADYDEEALSGLLKQAEVVRFCCEQTQLGMRGDLSLVFGSDLEHCELLKSAYGDLGLRVEVVSGEDNDAAKQNKIRALKTGTLDALINYNVFTEGTDIPEVNRVINLRPTKLSHLFVQILGRGLRPLIDPLTQKPVIVDGHPLKPRCTVVDIPPVDRLSLESSRSFIPLPASHTLTRAEALGVRLTERDALLASFCRLEELESHFKVRRAQWTRLDEKPEVPHCNTVFGFARGHGYDSLEAMVIGLRPKGWVYCPLGKPSSRESLASWEQTLESGLKQYTVCKRMWETRSQSNPLLSELKDLAEHPETIQEAMKRERSGAVWWRVKDAEFLLTDASGSESKAPTFVVRKQNELFKIEQRMRGHSVLWQSTPISERAVSGLLKRDVRQGSTLTERAGACFQLMPKVFAMLGLPDAALQFILNKTNPRFESARAFAEELHLSPAR